MPGGGGSDVRGGDAGASADGRRSLRDMWAMRRVVGGEKLDVMFFPAVYSFFPVPRSLPCVVTFHDVIAETLPHLVFTTRAAGSSGTSRAGWRCGCRARC